MNAYDGGHMHVGSWIRTAMVASTLSLAGSTLVAQAGSDAEWLERCRDAEGWGERGERHCEVREARLRATGRAIAVDGRENGSVRVEGRDGDSILVRARIQTQAPTAEEAREVAGRIRVETSGSTIHAEGPARRRGTSWSVSYTVYVPRRSDLSVEATNGSVSVEGVSGRMELRTMNGRLALRDVGGDVRGRTTNGSLNVDLAGQQWDGRGLDAETTNGAVRLTLPERYSARLETGTVNGSMQIDFPVTLQGRVGRHITTDLGSGGPPIRATTTNGSVSVKQRGAGS